MAVSAFKSTTKRIVGIGVGCESELSSGVPSQPSPGLKKSSHHRGQSLSDFSSRYLSDTASAAGDAAGDADGRHQSDDSVSDTESTYSRHTERSRQIAEIGASRKAALQNLKRNGTSQTGPLQRGRLADLTYKEISDFLRCIDVPGGSESVFTRLSTVRRRSDVTRNVESVFSRLAQPRHSTGNGLARSGVLKNGKCQGTRAGVLRQSTGKVDFWEPLHDVDDHSELESSHSRRTSRSRQSMSFGSSRIQSLPKMGKRQGVLRRSTNRAKISDPSAAEFWQPKCREADSNSAEETFDAIQKNPEPSDNDACNGNPEEERTIRVVHTQNKETGLLELDAVSLHDAMRAEMRKVVEDIRSEMEQGQIFVSKDRNLQTSCSKEKKSVCLPGDSDDEISAGAEFHREFAAKLEQSEKRAHDLWIQLTAEEHRRNNLVKLFGGLLPSQSDSVSNQYQHPPRQLTLTTGPEMEKQQHLDSEYLDEDAQRYLDECVSMYDTSLCGNGCEDSDCQECSAEFATLCSEARNCCRENEKKMSLLDPLITFCSQIEKFGICSGKPFTLFSTPVTNEDGLVLPWLQWETHTDGVVPEDVCRLGKKDEAVLGSHELTTGLKVCQSNAGQESNCADYPLGVSGLGCLGNGDLSSWTSFAFGHLKNGSYGSNGTLHDVHMIVEQRMWLGSGIKSGRILICGGTRF